MRYTRTPLVVSLFLVGLVVGAATFSALRLRLKAATALHPESNPGRQAVLDYDGPKIKVELIHKIVNGKETIDLVSDGRTLEHEEYQKTPDAFLLVNAAGETFDPNIPLISFNSDITDDGAWKGTMSSGGISRAASAVIQHEDSWVEATPISEKALAVTVKITLDGGGSTPAKRSLRFWIVKDKGVVQREFSDGVKRIPASGHL